MQKGRRSSLLLLLVGLILLSFTGYLFWQNQEKDITTEEAQRKVMKLTQEIESLETEILEISEITDIEEEQVAFRDELLKRKYHEINQLEAKIADLKRSKKVDAKTIRQLEDKLSSIRDDFVSRLRNEVNDQFQRSKELEQQMDTMKIWVDTMKTWYENRIARLEDALRKGGGEVPSSVSQPPAEATTFTKTVLDAVNFKFYAVSPDGGAKPGISFASQELEKVRICFDVLESPNIPVGEYTLYVEYKNPDGTLVFNEESDSRKVDGVNKGYSYQKTISYTGEKTQVCHEFFKPEGNFPPGLQRVEVFMKGLPIGRDAFEVK